MSRWDTTYISPFSNLVNHMWYISSYLAPPQQYTGHPFCHVMQLIDLCILDAGSRDLRRAVQVFLSPLHDDLQLRERLHDEGHVLHSARRLLCRGGDLQRAAPGRLPGHELLHHVRPTARPGLCRVRLPHLSGRSTCAAPPASSTTPRRETIFRQPHPHQRPGRQHPKAHQGGPLPRRRPARATAPTPSSTSRPRRWSPWSSCPSTSTANQFEDSKWCYNPTRTHHDFMAIPPWMQNSYLDAAITLSSSAVNLSAGVWGRAITTPSNDLCAVSILKNW